MGESSVTVAATQQEAPQQRHHAAQHTGMNGIGGQEPATTSSSQTTTAAAAATASTVAALGTNPGEVAFFKLLHAEVKKATHFFDQAQQEYAIREERVRKGMELMASQHAEYGSYATEDRWPRLAQSIFRLYRELLLLETFCIMTYCGFSKILKKHDKITGHSTKNAFMAKIVNNANFVNYPRVLDMITRCERLYEDVSERLVEDGQQALYEDERLFIHMIHRLNQKCVMPGGTCSPSLSSSSKTHSKTTIVGAPVPPKGAAQDKVSSPRVSLVAASPTTDQSRKLQELVAEIEEDQTTAAAAASRQSNGDDTSSTTMEGAAASKPEEDDTEDGTTTTTTHGEKRKAADSSTCRQPGSRESWKRQHHTDTQEESE